MTAAELEAQAGTYAQAIERAGRAHEAVETYHRHAAFFVRWLSGDFKSGGRLRRRRD